MDGVILSVIQCYTVLTSRCLSVATNEWGESGDYPMLHTSRTPSPYTSSVCPLSPSSTSLITLVEREWMH